MRGWLRGLLLWLALAQAGVVRAQDVPTSGRANNLVAAHSNEVGLEGLAVELEFLPDAEAFRVKAQFELVNHATREVRLALGMPEPRCETDSDEESACASPDAFRFEALESTLRGVPLPARRGRWSAHHEWAAAFGGVWLFDVRLHADERVAIEHRYVVPAVAGAGDAMRVTYVTRTGASWLEPIDKTTLTFLLPVNSCLVVEPEHIARRSRRVVLRDQTPWLQLTYGAQHGSPKGDLSLHFETCIPPRDTQLEGCSLLDRLAAFAYASGADTERNADPDPQDLIPNAATPERPATANPAPPPREPDPNAGPVTRPELKAQLAKLPQPELRRCGQAVFDAYASYYDARELAILANKPSAKRHYAAPLLTPEDWQWVGLVDEVLAERKNAKPATPPRNAAGGCATRAAERGETPRAWHLLLLAASALCARRKRSRGRARVR